MQALATRQPAAPDQEGIGLRSRLNAFLQQPAVAYLTIALLQLIAVGWMFHGRDLTSGDTAHYFRYAYGWYANGTDNIVWSPLYTTFYGSMLYLSPDPCTATLLHRLVIVFSATLLVLAVLRRLLPATVAWLIAAWWAVLPINFNTLYEVHLFAVLPILFCWWLVALRDSIWNRAAALAVLTGTALLVRNEMGLAALLFGGVCFWREWQQIRLNSWQSGLRRLGVVAAAYGLPMVAVGLLVLFFYERSICKPDAPGSLELGEAVRFKHEANMAQVFAFGYQQRHPEWNLSPWTDYSALMTRFFGKKELSLRAMLQVNPRSVLAHFLWNLRLVPNGLQVLLFNSTSGTINPDYAPVISESRPAWIASGVVSAIWIIGGCLLLRNRREAWNRLLYGRGMLLAVMGCVAAVAVPVILTQRPRPSYLFPLGIFLMAWTGILLTVILERLPLWRRYAPALPVLIVIGYFLAPLHPPLSGATPATPRADTVERLRPYASLIARDETRFLSGNYSFEVRSYLGHGLGECFDYGLFHRWPGGVPLATFLEQHQVNLLYLDAAELSRIENERAVEAKEFLTPGRSSWKLIGTGDLPGPRWRLYAFEP